jgi:hypothetical protein
VAPVTYVTSVAGERSRSSISQRLLTSYKRAATGAIKPEVVRTGGPHRCWATHGGEQVDRLGRVAGAIGQRLVEPHQVLDGVGRRTRVACVDGGREAKRVFGRRSQEVVGAHRHIVADRCQRRPVG